MPEKKADAVLGLVVVCFLLLLTILVVVCYICIRHKPQAYQPVAKEVKPFEQLPPADAPPIYFHRNPEERMMVMTPPPVPMEAIYREEASYREPAHGNLGHVSWNARP